MRWRGACTSKETQDGVHRHDQQYTYVADNDGWDAAGNCLGSGGNHELHNGVVTEGESSAHQHSFITSSVGSGESHENRPPYVALNYIIKC
jgi:microcystin-dependent protein